ncbi:MAG TPA: hypothetical protein VEJ20_02815, partial [Candidatus Eremiobacteraceae bacterium]|nr:hypothetical protein [Candidatus Eremiobacteraceae bacterium]
MQNAVSGVMGTPRVRPDARAKAQGSAVYAGDVRVEGALCGILVRSPHPFAQIKRVDVRRAASVPGVACIVWSENVPRKPLDFGIKDQHLFAVDYARYAGEPVAAIAAESEDAARTAAAAVEIEYEPLMPVLTIDDALDPDG